MIALDRDALRAIVRLMGDDVPVGFEERALADYGPGSAWAGNEPYDGPCLHELNWAVQCGCCPHEDDCIQRPSTFEMLVRDYLFATGRQAVDIEFSETPTGKEPGEIAF